MTVTVQQCIRFLAARCDGAFTRDAQGFSGTDTGLGKYLAELPDDQWTPAQIWQGWDFTRKYRGQLEGAGYDVDALAEPPRPAAEDIRQEAQTDRVAQRRGEVEVVEGEVKRLSDRRLELETLTDRTFGTAERFVLKFPYDQTMVDTARNVPGRVYHGALKANSYPTTTEAAGGLLAFMAQYEGFDVTAGAREMLDELFDPDAEPPAWGTVNMEDGKFLVDFPYEREVVGQMQKVTGRRWDRARKINTVPRTPVAAEELTLFIADHRERGWDIADDVAAELRALVKRAAAEREGEVELREISVAEDGEIDIEGLGGELRPFQKAGVQYALKTRRTFIADDMGTGKTVQALAALLATDTFPAIVVCPQTMKLAWKKHITGPTPGAPNGWLPGKRVRVLEGRKPNPRALQGADVVVINYDILPDWVGTLKAMRPKALIADESHYVKSSKAKRTKGVKALAKAVPADGLVLLLTGTAIKNRPIEYAAQLEILGRLENFGGFMAFAKRYCGAYKERYGWNMDGATNLPELNERLRGLCYIRRRKSDIMKELPPKQIATVPVELSNPGEYARVEDDVIAWLRDQVIKDEDFLLEIADMDEDAQRLAKRARQNDAQFRAERAKRLVQLNKLRVVAAQGKIKPATDWINDFLEDGDEKLVIFADHIEVQKGLLEALRSYRPARVLGEDSAEDRQAAVARFQEDDNCRVIVCSLKAAGIGITLTAASNVVFIEQGWTPADMDQAEDRLHRIGQDDQVTAWYLIAEDTIDEQMAGLIASKRAVVTAAADGREDTSRVNIQAEIIEKLLAKGRG